MLDHHVDLDTELQNRFSQWNPPAFPVIHRSEFYFLYFSGGSWGAIWSRYPPSPCILNLGFQNFKIAYSTSEGCTIQFHGKPNLDKADWNNVENAWDELWSSAFILICDLADDVLIIHSTRYIDAASTF